MKYTKNILGSFFATLILFAFVLSPVFAATEVISGNTSAGQNLPGWLFNRDTSTSTAYEFNYDHAVLGSGSLYVPPIQNTNYSNLLGNNPNWDKFVGENFTNTPIANINSISYDYRIDSSGEEADKDHFYMNVYANFGESDDNKFYDCRYNVVPTTGSTAGFTTVTFDPTQAYSVTTRTGAPGTASPYTCPAIPAQMDNLSPGSNMRVFALNVGDTSANDTGVGGYFDNVVVNLDSGTTTYDLDPKEVKVVINKYIDGLMATSTSADGLSFPMIATWNAENLGAGSGNYTLSSVGFNSSNSYQAVTSDMTAGADYSTSEVTGGPVVGENCSGDQPFALVGYTTGNSLSEAQSATPSSTAPSFVNLQNDTYVIVWNETCEDPTPTPTMTPTPTPDPYAVPLACSATGNTYGAPIIGTEGSNKINGTAGPDLIFGLGGSDKIDGKGGNDCIVGGAGSNKIDGGTGNDVIIGGDDSDSLDGGSDDDIVYGMGGSDSLKGGSGNDELWGGNGNDALNGDSRNDTLRGEGGSDSAKGGSGNSDDCDAESEKQCEI